MSACVRIREELSAYLDGRLDRSVKAAVEAHLAGCAACAREVASLGATRRLVASAGRLKAPEAWVRGAIAAASGRGRGPARREARVTARPWAVSSLAAAAVLAVVAVSLRLYGPALPGLLPETDRPAAPAAPEAGPEGGPASPLKQDAATPEADRAAAKAASPGEAPAVEPRELRSEPAGPKGGTLESALRRDAAAPAPPAAAPAPEPPADREAAAPPAPESKKERAAEVASFDLPRLRVDLARIRFPRAPGAAREEKPAVARGRDEGGLPPAASTPSLLGAAAPRILRARVRIDAASKILAASAIEGAAAREDLDLIARLPGAALELPGPPPAAGEAILEILLPADGGP
jgi:anti-sigma factor RsiW